MPAEATPVTVAAPGAAPVNVAAPEAAPAPVKPADPGPAKPSEQTVPISRLNQESGKRVRAENSARQLQEQLQTMQQRLADIEASNTPPPAGRSFKDQTREQIFRELGGGQGDTKADAAAMAAIRQLDDHANVVLQERGAVSAEDVGKIVQHYVGLSEQKQQVLYGVTNRVNNWIQKGIVSQDQAQQIHGKVMETIKQYPEIMQSPHNIGYLLDREFAAAVESGEVKPYSTPAPTSAVQPAGYGAATVIQETDYSKSPLRALRNIDPDRLKKARQMSIANHRAATEAR